MTATAIGASLEHPLGAEGLLSIRLRNGDVRIRGLDSDRVTIRDVNGHDLSGMFAVVLGEGNVSLRSTRDSGGSSPDLEIDLPRRATLVVETTSGDIEVDGLVGDQRYRTASGEVQLRAVTNRIAVEAVSGDIDVVATGEAEVSLRTVSGDVALHAGTLRSLQATSTSGDLKVAGRLLGPGPFKIVTVSGDMLLAPAGDVRVEMATLSGDLESELDGVTESRRGHRSLLVGSGEPLVEFRSMSGDLSVVRPTAVPARTTPSGEAALDPWAAAADTPTERLSTSEPANGAIVAAYEDARLRILRSLERGEIGVEEAGLRLEALDRGPGGPGTPTDGSTGA
jgi:DUF4097 and DUF4098 domain-containing protein YvlB